MVDPEALPAFEVISIFVADDSPRETIMSITRKSTASVGPDLESYSDTVTLRSVFLHVTKACNLRCSYCYFSASQPLPNEMTTADFVRLWPELVALRPQRVVFTGGEPLLRPDILDLLRSLRDADPEHHILRCLNSNGHLVTLDLAEKLVALVDEVRVSLDGMRAHNDRLRGAGNFDAAVRALEYYYTVGFEPKVLVTVSSISILDLEELLCYLIDKKITHINLNSFRPIGRGKSHPELMVQTAQISAAVERALSHCLPGYTPAIETQVPESCSNCGVGSFLNIMPNGDVYPCHVLVDREFRCGNVRTQPLRDICRSSGLLGNLQALDFRELGQQDERVNELKQPQVCLGNVYSKTKTLPLWQDVIPLLKSTPPK